LADARIIGVLGGLGPAATVDFFARVVAATPAERDQDHIHLIIDNNPHVPNRNAGIAGTGPSPGPYLAAMARRLEAAGAHALAMPCNAAHAFQAEIRAAVSIDLISILDATCDQAARQAPQLQVAGIMAAQGCLQAELYQRAFAARGLSTIVPTPAELTEFMNVLSFIKRGELSDAVRGGMRALADAQIERGAEVIVAGCTEIPLVLRTEDVTVPLINSTAALVSAVGAYAKQN